MIVAIDGVAASGKGTLTEFLAKYYDCEFLPTGNLYRIIAKHLIEKGIDLNKFALNPLKINLIYILEQENVLDTDLGSDKISKVASRLAKITVVRQVLTEYQREWIRKRKMAIVEGRDIGTIVWPEAEVKLFLVADPKIRARRRVHQLHEGGSIALEEEIYAHLLERDKRDRSRKVAPMKMAKDAILLDTTNLTIEEMQRKAVQLIEKKIDNTHGKV